MPWPSSVSPIRRSPAHEPSVRRFHARLLTEVPDPDPALPPFPMLDEGESAAIRLALKLSASVLMDEKSGRKIATNLGLHVIGSAGVLVAAKKRGLIDVRSAAARDVRGQRLPLLRRPRSRDPDAGGRGVARGTRSPRARSLALRLRSSGRSITVVIRCNTSGERRGNDHHQQRPGDDSQTYPRCAAARAGQLGGFLGQPRGGSCLATRQASVRRARVQATALPPYAVAPK